MFEQVQKMTQTRCEIASNSDVVIFVASARPTNADMPSHITMAQIEAARNALSAVLGIVGIDIRTSATIGKFAPVELADGETLRLVVDAALEKTAPEPVDETQPEPTPEGE